MIFNKPKFWDKKISIFSIILIPVSLLFVFLTFLKKKFSKPRVFKLPIICIGNIYIGGTGKTPTSIFLAKEILKLGKKTAILRKYYENHKDEYNLINKNFKNLILNKNRIDALKKLEKSDCDLVILDDGFQDFRIKKDLNIICFNQNQLVGNGLVLPSGPLRENLIALKRANIVIINGKKDKKFEDKILNINKDLDILYSSYTPLNIEEFKNKKLLAIAGIGNPENFFKLLSEYGLKIEKKLIFPDHHVFSNKEIQNFINESKNKNYQIVMTEKDFYKISDYNLKDIKYLKVSLEIKEKEKLLNKIKKLYDKNN